MKNWFSSLGLTVRIVSLVAVLMCAIVGTNNWIVFDDFRKNTTAALIHEAAAFTSAAESTKNTAAEVFGSGAYHMEELEAEAAETLETGGDYRDTRLYKGVPVILAWESAEDAAEKAGLEFKVQSWEARNPDHEPDEGSLEAELLTKLNAQFDAGAGHTIYGIDEERNELVFMRGIELTEECMMCHGYRGNEWDTDGDGYDQLGFAMEDWDVGDMHGAWTVVMPLDKMDAAMAGLTWNIGKIAGPLAVGGFIVFIFLMRRLLGSRISSVAASLERASQGNLATRVSVTGADELGSIAASLNGFLESLDDSFSQISSGSSQIEAGSSQLASASQVLAAGTADQASSLEEISASLEEMSSMTEQNSEHAQEAFRLTAEAADASTRGSSEMSRMNTAVDEIKASSLEISKVIKVIDDIAFQTNLLALNAAVEAARAGEAGKGFAVVAEEVRSLAQRSAEAAKETAALIEESSRRSDAGVEISERVAAVLGEVVNSVNQVNSLVGEIASASQEQATGIGQINSGVANLERVVQQNASSAEELASTSEQTSGQVVMVKEMIERFEVTDALAARSNPFQSGAPRTISARVAPVRPLKAPIAGIPMDDGDEMMDGFGDAAFANDEDLTNF
jgi:methyl-accepting chemotaxis protein